MNKNPSNITKCLKFFKALILSIINYFINFFQRKKTIDNMYTNILKDRSAEIKTLEKNFKSIHDETILLEKELISINNSLNKKNSLILGLQDLLTKRVDN